MKSKFFLKLISIILAVIFAFSASPLSLFAEDETTTAETTAATEETTSKVTKEEAQKTLEEQKAELEKKIKESEEKLATYEESAKTTEEYIDALDEKIGYINEELTMLDKEVSEAKKKVDDLNKQIEPLEKELESLQAAYDESQKEFERLNEDFTETYNAYCLRLRAMYISGTDSVIATLLTSEDISQFFSRYEMIKAVAKSDTELLKEVNTKMAEIITKQDGLNERKAALSKTQQALATKRAACKKEQDKIEKNQKAIAAKKVILSEDRAESDRLFAIYAKQTAMYTEFRNEDEELIKQVDDEIDALLSGLKAPDEVTTVFESEHDTSKYGDDIDSDSSLYSKSDGVLNLTYPAPGHYSVSQSFGHYRNGRAHTGIDFPCPTGSKIVASQKGIVITVKRLNYSYGYYVMVYHGTDSRGRKIVTLYAHNSSILVSVGQTVSKGQQIAKSGSTGNSTGPHCHYEVIIDGSKVNPKNYLSK